MDTKYMQIDAEEKERLPRISEDTEVTLLDHGDTKTRIRLGPLWLWLLQASLLFTSLVFFITGLVFRPTTRTFVEKFSAYSPALHAVEYERVMFNVSKGAPTPFVGVGPEADRAWDHVTLHMGDQMISEAELEMLGKPTNRLRVTDEDTGEIGFRMELAVVHQLHCLNLLRKAVHRDHYEPLGGDLAVPSEKLNGHLNHCIEALRMKLMCEADVGVITYHKEPNVDGKMEPDYDALHVCRNFDRVREWAVENTVAKKVTF